MGSKTDVAITSGGLRLQGQLCRPGREDEQVGALQALLLCHGFPAGPRGDAESGQTYAQLAERLAQEAGWAVLAVDFRGMGDSEGDFSLGGWMADLRAAIDYLVALPGLAGVWLAGFSAGGSLAICAAGEDERVSGAASLGAPADFGDWAADPTALADEARRLGLIRSPDFPPDPPSWARELRELRPLALAGKIPPRPLLIVHGADDDVVPPADARALVDAAQGQADLRMLAGAGHRLRHDPRAIAVLLGWLERLVS
ncbi:MAG TPA: alpha/beta fold hydrolase [Acidimicrobiales bacterium]|nr:alpha/beta fold hydrolase [Acidimicrobiales bacterium]